jgi:hypothetical protein
MLQGWYQPGCQMNKTHTKKHAQLQAARAAHQGHTPGKKESNYAQQCWNSVFYRMVNNEHAPKQTQHKAKQESQTKNAHLAFVLDWCFKTDAIWSKQIPV